MEIITYSLRGDRARSDQYYTAVAAFTDEVLARSRGAIQDLAAAFQAYSQENNLAEPRVVPVYVFELLTLGILWRVYSHRALGLSAVSGWGLTMLSRLRRQVQALKAGIDVFRGVLGTLLLPANGSHAAPLSVPSIEQLDKLIGWLAATGDFEHEVRRLRFWRDYFVGLPDWAAVRDIQAVLDFAAWFEARSEVVLGDYTAHVERFLAETHSGYRWREDAIFCGRQRSEYHLNMVGTEILNRAFREAFLKSPGKIVLAPPCMRAQPENLCKAEPTGLGARCMACMPGCRVHQLTMLGRKRGFQVLLLPDDLRVFSGQADRLTNTDIGIVGISCALTNAPGGLRVGELNVPAQGVLLDYCGCSWHWHPEGIPTDINFNQLLKVLALAPIRSEPRSTEPA